MEHEQKVIYVPELKAPFIVDFEITQRCSLQCFFCEADIPNMKPAFEVETNEIFHLLQKLAKAGITNIFFTGGEPLLRKDLPDLIRYCFERGLDPCISTSGFSLDGMGIKQIIDAGLDSLQVSIHGPKDIHEMVVGKKGSYAMAISALEIAAECGVKAEIACVGLKENLEYIPVLIYELAPFGVSFFRLLRYVPGYRKEMLTHIPPKRLAEKCIPEIERAARECNIELGLGFCPGLDKTSLSVVRGVHPSAFSCPAGKTQFAIMPNGDVYPCIFFKHRPEMLCGNILGDSIDKIWNNPKMVEFRRLTPKDYTGICGSCERKWLCYSARCIAYNLSDDLYGNDLSCYIVRERLSMEV